MTAKPKVAFYWCSSCGGCEETVVDLAEAILDITEAVEIAFWPVALDYKRDHVDAMPDRSIAATFLNGAIRTEEQKEMARLLRQKSELLVAFGSCSHLGGIPGLANLFDRESVMRTVYLDSPSTANKAGVFPQTHYGDNGRTLSLPAFHNTVRTLDQVVEVDYYVPGCPPTPRILRTAIQTLLGGDRPAVGAVLAPDCALCEECPRKDTKPETLSIPEFKRPQDLLIDEQSCLLTQGLVCMGPATRAGCEASCIQGNMPCTGCGGPTSRVQEQGAKILSCLASLVESKEDAEIDQVLNTIPDPVGTFYRYALAASFLRRKTLPRVQVST
ncbi:MAG TPA: hypothetical protein VLT90_11790 [Terriglobales bacterium]|nr:hypothetical protein [Terriglobales bacterium]